jgi:hypothetical protein
MVMSKIIKKVITDDHEFGLDLNGDLYWRAIINNSWYKYDDGDKRYMDPHVPFKSMIAIVDEFKPLLM